MITRAAQMAALAEYWPTVDFELHSRDPWVVLVVGILMSRTSVVRAEEVGATILATWARPVDVADLHPLELEPALGRLAGRREKARAVVEAGRAITHRHGGVVPAVFDELSLLPGVSRRVAGLVVAVAFGAPAVVVDDHVTRVVHRLGWTVEEDRLAAEIALQHDLPPQHWTATSSRLSHLGHTHCRPKVARCDGCPLASGCLTALTRSRSKDGGGLS